MPFLFMPGGPRINKKKCVVYKKVNLTRNVSMRYKYTGILPETQYGGDLSLPDAGVGMLQEKCTIVPVPVQHTP